MPDELTDLLDTAIYKEIAAQALYTAAEKKTDDPGARSLMKELAQDELRHSRELTKLKDNGGQGRAWHVNRLADLKISDYLAAPDSPEGAGLQDLLIFAMKREEESVAFYSNLMGTMRDEAAKHLCEVLAAWELRHKLKLEILYDNLFFKED